MSSYTPSSLQDCRAKRWLFEASSLFVCEFLSDYCNEAFSPLSFVLPKSHPIDNKLITSILLSIRTHLGSVICVINEDVVAYFLDKVNQRKEKKRIKIKRYLEQVTGLLSNYYYISRNI